MTLVFFLDDDLLLLLVVMIPHPVGFFFGALGLLGFFGLLSTIGAPPETATGPATGDVFFLVDIGLFGLAGGGGGGGALPSKRGTVIGRDGAVDVFLDFGAYFFFFFGGGAAEVLTAATTIGTSFTGPSI